MNMPTWPGEARVPSEPGMKTRSPGDMLAGVASRPSWTCVYVVRLSGTPAELQAACISPEQS